MFGALDEEDAISIKMAKELLNDSTIKGDLIFIAANYGFLGPTITKLETSGLKLSSQIGMVQHAIDSISGVNGEVAETIKNKIASVIVKNCGFDFLKTISEILAGDATVNSITDQYTIKEISAFKFAPLTSVEVERSFSMYKNVLRSNRQSFIFENLSEIFVIYCNNNLN